MVILGKMASTEEIKELETRIVKFKDLPIKNNGKQAKSNYNLAMTIAIEVVSALFVGVLLGVFLDKFFSSKPLFLLICMLFSMAAAFKTIWKKARS